MRLRLRDVWSAVHCEYTRAGIPCMTPGEYDRRLTAALSEMDDAIA